MKPPATQQQVLDMAVIEYCNVMYHVSMFRANAAPPSIRKVAVEQTQAMVFHMMESVTQERFTMKPPPLLN
jgi:hypothetical protein